MISETNILISLHALAEVFHEFSTTNKTFSECAAEFCIDDLAEIIQIPRIQIILNNFCEQKDEYFAGTDNEDYTGLNIKPYDFSKMNLLGNTNFSHKDIIREARNGIEHHRCSIADDGVTIHIDNPGTGFSADFNLDFFEGANLAHLIARQYDYYELDVRNIDYNNSPSQELSKLKVSRILPKQKRNQTNYGYLNGEQDRYQKMRDEANDLSQYDKNDRILESEQIQLLEKYFETHEFNQRNLVIATKRVLCNANEYSKQINWFASSFLLYFYQKLQLQKQDFTYEEMIHDQELIQKLEEYSFGFPKDEIPDSFELLDNYFRTTFIKYYYQNKLDLTPEETHIRNCMCHSRYTKNAEPTILLIDHRNGFANETNHTFKNMYNVEELYRNVEDRYFGEQVSYSVHQ